MSGTNSAFERVVSDLRTTKLKLREARQVMVYLRAEIAAKRAVLALINGLSKGGTDHLTPEEAVRIRTIQELSSRNCEHPETPAKYARSLPSEAKRGVSFAHLTSNEPAEPQEER